MGSPCRAPGCAQTWHRMPAGCVGARSAASPLPGGAWGSRRVSRCCAPTAVRLPGPGDAARGALTAPGLGWLLDLGAACNSLGLICCFFFFPARSAKRSQKWQLHGSAGLVPLAAVGDKWENARGRREGGVSGAWRQRPRPCPESSVCSVALLAPFQGALPVSARLHPPGVPVTQHYPSPHTTQGRGADCLLSPLLFLWQPRAHEGVAGGCAAPTAIPVRPFLLQPKRLRCDRCSSARILPPRLPQEARAEGLGQSWKRG